MDHRLYHEKDGLALGLGAQHETAVLLQELAVPKRGSQGQEIKQFSSFTESGGNDGI